jgi:hypothetical protein
MSRSTTGSITSAAIVGLRARSVVLGGESFVALARAMWATVALSRYTYPQPT